MEPFFTLSMQHAESCVFSVSYPPSLVTTLTDPLHPFQFSSKPPARICVTTGCAFRINIDVGAMACLARGDSSPI